MTAVLRSQVEVEQASNGLGFIVYLVRKKQRVDETFVLDDDVEAVNPDHVDVFHIAQEIGLARFNNTER